MRRFRAGDIVEFRNKVLNFGPQRIVKVNGSLWLEDYPSGKNRVEIGTEYELDSDALVPTKITAIKMFYEAVNS